MLAPLPSSAEAGLAGTYRCWSFNVGGHAGRCELSPPLLLHGDGTYDISSEHGTYKVEGGQIFLSKSKVRGPGTFQNGNQIVFRYYYRGLQQTVTYLCQDCSVSPGAGQDQGNATPSSQTGGYGTPPQDSYGTPPPQNGGDSAPPQDNYGTPPAQTNGYGSSPQDNYGTPPQDSYGTPQQQGNYGTPPPQPGGYGALPQGTPPPQENDGQAASRNLNQNLKNLISGFKSLINSFRHKQPQDNSAGSDGGTSPQGGYGTPPPQNGGDSAPPQDSYGTPPPQGNNGTPPQGGGGWSPPQSDGGWAPPQSDNNWKRPQTGQ